MMKYWLRLAVVTSAAECPVWGLGLSLAVAQLDQLQIG